MSHFYKIHCISLDVRKQKMIIHYEHNRNSEMQAHTDPEKVLV